MIVSETEIIVVPLVEQPLTVISNIEDITVIAASENVSVLSLQESTTVISQDLKTTVVPLQDQITIIANPVSSGSKVTISSSAPSSPNIGDIWVQG